MRRYRFCETFKSKRYITYRFLIPVSSSFFKLSLKSTVEKIRQTKKYAQITMCVDTRWANMITHNCLKSMNTYGCEQ